MGRSSDPTVTARELRYLGFVDEQRFGTHTRWNAGESDGGNATFAMYVNSGHTLVVLANYDPPAAYLVNDEFAR